MHRQIFLVLKKKEKNEQTNQEDVEKQEHDDEDVKYLTGTEMNMIENQEKRDVYRNFKIEKPEQFKLNKEGKVSIS